MVAPGAGAKHNEQCFNCQLLGAGLSVLKCLGCGFSRSTAAAMSRKCWSVHVCWATLQLLAARWCQKRTVGSEIILYLLLIHGTSTWRHLTSLVVLGWRSVRRPTKGPEDQTGLAGCNRARSLQPGISDLGFGLEFVKKLLQCSGIMSIALEVAATLPPYLSTLQKTHQLQTLHRWIHLRYGFFVRQIRGDLRIKRCGFTLGNQNKYFQTLQIAFHINLYGYCVFHMTCQGFSTFDALPSKLLAGYNITKLSKHTCLVERSLGVKLPTIWIDGKTQVGSVREEKGRRKIREEKESEEGRCRCVREKVEKVGTLWFSDVSWLPRVEKEGY